MTTPYVVIVCTHFQSEEIPGSMNSWCKPTGVDSKSSKMNVSLVNESLNTVPL